MVLWFGRVCDVVWVSISENFCVIPWKQVDLKQVLLIIFDNYGNEGKFISLKTLS